LATTQLHVPELELFIDEGWITDVLFTLRSGKEATAYCCAGGPTSAVELVAAKRYRPLDSRGFKNDAVYQAGRWDAADRRTRLAFEKKSRAGREAQFGSWVEHEYRTLELLHAAGADVPAPVTKSSEVILMEFVGDDRAPAPQLRDIRLAPDEAHPLFERQLDNIAVWLAHDRIHGDLSPFNILYWEGRLTTIDFPQAVDPHTNPNAFDLLRRDIGNVCRYFTPLGVRADAERIAGDLWMRWRFGELPTTLAPRA
jgi:RIO kinase 1